MPTSKVGISSWWTPDVKIEAKESTIVKFIFRKRYHNKMLISKLIKNHYLEWMCMEGDEEWINTKISFQLKEINNKTHLTFSQSDWRLKTDFYYYCSKKWEEYLLSLKLYCEAEPVILTDLHPNK